MRNDVGSGRRLPIALAVFVGWVLITLFSMRWASDGTDKALVDTVSQGVSWNIVLAALFLAITAVVMKWRDLGFVAPASLSSLSILWFPALYLLCFAAMALVLGLPPMATVFFVFLNTIVVGISEEFMFRGILFRAWRSRLSIWPAIIITTVMFGGVHVMNVFVTGQFGEAGLQAIAAALSGFAFMALLIRTGSIWVPIVYHALWDFGTFLVSAGAGNAADAELQGLGIMLIPIALVLPNFLYALYLLRKLRDGTAN